LLVAKMIVSSGAHVAPLEAPSRLASAIDGPPVIATLWSPRSMKPTH
jgi:hypothetical protein